MDILPRTSGIYKITCVPTGKIYVGSATSIYHRWNTHRYELGHGKHGNLLLQNAWNKYGASSFVCDVVELVSVQSLIEREQYWIDQTQCCNRAIGFNILKFAGSSLGTKRSDAVRQRMSETRIGRKMPPFTPEHRAQLAAAAKDRMKDPVRRAAVSKVHKGKIISTEHRIRASDANKGRVHSKKTLDAIIERHAGTYLVTSPTGETQTIKNMAEFCRINKLDRSGMRKVLDGNQRNHKGWTCQRIHIP